MIVNIKATNKSYPFGHDDGEMSPRVPKDNSSLTIAATVGYDGGGDQSCKITKATWLAKAF